MIFPDESAPTNKNHAGADGDIIIDNSDNGNNVDNSINFDPDNSATPANADNSDNVDTADNSTYSDNSDHANNSDNGDSIDNSTYSDNSAHANNPDNSDTSIYSDISDNDDNSDNANGTNCSVDITMEQLQEETISQYLSSSASEQNESVLDAVTYIQHFDPSLLGVFGGDDHHAHHVQAQVHQEDAAQPDPVQDAESIAQEGGLAQAAPLASLAQVLEPANNVHAHLLPTEPLPLQQLERECVTIHGDNGLRFTLKFGGSKIGGKGMNMALVSMENARQEAAESAKSSAKIAKTGPEIAKKAPRSRGKAPRGKPAIFAEKSRPPFTMEPASISMPELVKPTLIKKRK